jgi:tetratricopeptide (TPR) repeat protein
MVFGRLFSSRGVKEDPNHVEGQRLFELGVARAAQYKTSEAIDYYTKSIAINPNPSPYLNRANLLGKRVRHYEALQDLYAAKGLDKAREFTREIQREIAKAEAMTHLYRDGTREKLIADLEQKDAGYVAERILCTSFGINAKQWSYSTFDWQLVEYHFFNELDNLVKFEEREKYESSFIEYIDLFPPEFVDLKVRNCPDGAGYAKAEVVLNSFLCIYPEAKMRQLRAGIIYMIHDKMMHRDYDIGEYAQCSGLTREAAEYVERHQLQSDRF